MDPNGIHVDRDDDNQVPCHTFDGKQTIYQSLSIYKEYTFLIKS